MDFESFRTSHFLVVERKVVPISHFVAVPVLERENSHLHPLNRDSSYLPLAVAGPQTAAVYDLVAVANSFDIVVEVYTELEVVAASHNEQAAVEMAAGVIGLVVVVLYY